MARSRATYPCSNRQGSRSSSTSRPRTLSGSTFRPPSSPTPTRSSNETSQELTHFGTGCSICSNEPSPERNGGARRHERGPPGAWCTVRYTNFHSTALCSPTRAALITGRNHHSVGFGVIGEMSTGYPGYNSIIGPESATVGTILRDNGFATSWFGKNHNTPTYQYSAAGPFDLWPVGMGFDYFYG